MSDRVAFEVVPDAEREEAQRVRGKAKYDLLFEALWGGATVRLDASTVDDRMANAIRAAWGHKHRGITIHVIRSQNREGWVLWADVNGAAK